MTARCTMSLPCINTDRVTGPYRKIHLAIWRSVYRPGSETPVFRAGELTFGIVICSDSNDPESAGCMAVQNAAVVFIPTNNGLPNRLRAKVPRLTLVTLA
jgi:predicted amidohydrolase